MLRSHSRRSLVRSLGHLSLGLAIAFAGVAISGCTKFSDPLGTPAFSSKERFAQMRRKVDLEWRMMNDDIDMVLMLRQPSALTPWHIP